MGYYWNEIVSLKLLFCIFLMKSCFGCYLVSGIKNIRDFQFFTSHFGLLEKCTFGLLVCSDVDQNL